MQAVPRNLATMLVSSSSVYVASYSRTSSCSRFLRKAGRMSSGGLVIMSIFRPSSISSSSESSYSLPNVIVSSQTRRKSISLSGVCSPRAKDPNRYASRTSWRGNTREPTADMSTSVIMVQLRFSNRMSGNHHQRFRATCHKCIDGSW